MEGALEKIVSPYKGRKGAVVPVLQEIQASQGYISPEAVEVMSRELGISDNEIYGVATFYAQFRFQPPGKHTLKVCLGTACHVRGAVSVLEELERALGVKSGETTKDGMFTLETVMCLGCCAQGPMLVVGEEYHGNMQPSKVKGLLDAITKKEAPK
jgi:NADH-quinone oxidoreductase E subunit